MIGPIDPALLDDLVSANHVLYDQGVVDGSGHVSVRHNADDNYFLMSRNIAPGQVTKDDILVYDLDSEPVDADPKLKHYNERFIHGAIYRKRPDVRAVIHSHSPTVVPFTVTTVPLRPIAQVSGFLGLGTPVWDIRSVDNGHGFLVKNGRLGESLAETLADSAVVLMRGHGSTVVGKSLPQVVWRAVYTEINAKQQVITTLLGGPVTYLSPEESAYAAENTPANPTRAWNQWKEMARRRLERSERKD
jgi:HCOMODA/2-hydroxy-3-carboxy-muconic semialdehyde decarboxylase